LGGEKIWGGTKFKGRGGTCEVCVKPEKLNGQKNRTRRGRPSFHSPRLGKTVKSKDKGKHGGMK